MPIRATGPQGAATRRPWKTAPIPPGLDRGPIELAVRTMLRACEAQAGDVDRILLPALGLASSAPASPLRLKSTAPLSVHRTRWLLSEAASFGRRVGPPPALTTALVMTAQLGVVSAPVLSRVWRDAGLTDAVLDPQTVEKIARQVYGLDPGFRVLSGEAGLSRTPLVLARRLDGPTLAAATTIRPVLRSARMVPITKAARLAPGLDAEEVGRLCEACWTLSPDRQAVLDWQPKGLDHGIGRILTSAEQSLPARVVHEQLPRWARGGADRAYTWTARHLAQYLAWSPLYDSSPGRAFSVAGDWAALSDSDRHVLHTLDVAGTPAARPRLIEILVDMGYTNGSAKQLIAVSPVAAKVGRGLYAKVGT